MNTDYSASNTSEVKGRIEVVSYITAGLWAGLLVTMAMIMFLHKDYWHLRWIFFPLSLSISIINMYLYRSPSYVNSLYKKLSDKGSSNVTLSVMYYNYLHYKYARTAICLVVLAIIYSVLVMYNLTNQSFISVDIITFAMVLLIIARLFLIKKRVSSGIFGTNSEEAIELIRFILANSKEVDFSDGDGNPKNGFLPEELVSLDLLPPAQEVRA